MCARTCMCAYACVRAFALIGVHVRTCACVLRACALVYAGVLAFARGCVCLRACVYSRGRYACPRVCVCVNTCVFVRQIYKELLITLLLIKIKANVFLSINYAPKLFFWYINHLFIFYGIIVISIYLYCATMATLT